MRQTFSITDTGQESLTQNRELRLLAGKQGENKSYLYPGENQYIQVKKGREGRH